MWKVWKVLLLGAVSFIHVLTGLDMRQCNRALGMESGRIEDRQISASSTFDEQSTGPKNARLNLESGSGAWCPLHQINETSHEWLQIEFSEDIILTGIETQGRFDKGRGMEFATGYMIEYWRSSLGRWARYKNSKGEEIVDGNQDTRSTILRILDGAIIAKIIRLIPVSQVTRTICMRIELHGCSLRTSLASYSAPVGSRFDGLDLRDFSYDGDEFDNGKLVNGIGKLFDGVIGEDNFEKHPGAWVGWHKSAIQTNSIILEFSFTERRNFSAIVLHTSNSKKQGAGLFSTAKIFFSTSDDDLYSQRIITFEQISDEVFETARWVKIGINHRLAKKIRIELIFGENSDWLLLSEIKFESKPALRIDSDSEDDSIISINPKNIGVIATVSVDDHSNLFITTFLAFSVILAAILLIICNLNSRLGKNQNLTRKVLPDVETGYFNYKKYDMSVSSVSTKRYIRTPEGQSFDDEYANPDLETCLLGQIYASTEIYNLPEQDDYSPIKIDAKDLKFVQNVGIGEFGKVDLCRLKDKLVAVKSLRPEAESMESDFKKEIHLMSQLRHSNIIRVIGTTKIKPIFCVTEFMENGDLRQFLSKIGKIDEEQLLGMATQIAAGMAYLESRKFIHRDLAARNCFVDTDLTIKIGDFGMAKSLYGSDYYRIDGEFAFPIRWMAWESVFEGRFSHKTDAWSFAVTLWELYSECREKPFQQLTDSQIIQNLQSVIVNGVLKEHLCRPTKCPMPIYTEIMLPCWKKQENERPTLVSIHRFLQSLQFSQPIRCPPPPNRSAPEPPL